MISRKETVPLAPRYQNKAHSATGTSVTYTKTTVAAKETGERVVVSYPTYTNMRERVDHISPEK